jgi:hypothetical protein
MASKTPPTEHLDWASAAASVVDPGEAKKATGFLTGEAPGAGELNYIYQTCGKWNELVSKSLAGSMAMNNIDFTGASPWGYAGHGHVQYLPAADKWYSVFVSTLGGDVYVRDSDDGETWSSPKLVAYEAAATGNDTSKMITNGSYIAIAVDNTIYWSSDLTVANISSSATISVIDLVSDLVYAHGIWIACGADTGTGFGKIVSGVTPATMNTVRYTATGSNVNAMATSDDGTLSVAVENTGTVCIYSTNGTTWTGATTDAPQSMNHISWAPSMNGFVGLGYTTDKLYTTIDGVTWVDQFAVNGVPTLWNIAHTPDFFVAWEQPTTSTNGIDYYNVLIFPNPVTHDNSITWENYGQAWGETVPYAEDDTSIFHGGQGKLIFYYNASGHSAIGRYGAA